MTRENGHRSSWPGRLAGLGALVSLLLFGFLFGALVATRVLYTTAMGWDQLGGAFGGGALGAFAGLVAGVFLVGRLTVRRRALLALVALVGAVMCLVYLRSTPPRVRPPTERTAATIHGELP